LRLWALCAGILRSTALRVGEGRGVLRWIPIVVEIGLLVYALLDCIQTESLTVRNLPKTLWVLLIIFLPIVGSVAWLVAGRPAHTASTHAGSWPSTRPSGSPQRKGPPLGPDDDPEFLASLRESDAQHEQMLKDWEAQLRERERKLQDGEPDDDHPESSPGSPAGEDR
jgi:hypothetical protein